MKTTDRTDTFSCCLPTQAVAVEVAVSRPDFTSPTQRRTDLDLPMIDLDGGWFQMGANDGPHPEDGEGPVREVWVDPFAISATAVTNAEYQAFVQSTGYRTLAERFGSSFVFHSFLDNQERYPAPKHAPWWRDVRGAYWAKPEGPSDSTVYVGDNSTTGREDHPVVHLALEDVIAYCRWSSTRLPTEAEWEFAARGGLVGKPFPWGEPLAAENQHQANVWQGIFPECNTGEDGYSGTAPVTAYAPNDFGLFNMVGNVWEWTADRFTHLHSPKPIRNPEGPLNGKTYVTKGGSYLCHASYCARYRVSSRQALSSNTTAGNIGFRVVANGTR